MMQILRKSLNLTFFIALTALGLHAQNPREELLGITSRPTPQGNSIENVKKKVTGLALPVSDDFSYAQKSSMPRPGLWLDSNVYVNTTYSVDPITLGVATFDGLNKYGLPYKQGQVATDSTDMLTSQPINLSGTAGEVVLSFYFQSEGLGERPTSEDSLTLYFYSPTTMEWKSVWRTLGEDTKPFELVQIPITQTRYLQDNFQFRFIAFGSPGGAFDMWHIDRVLLDDERDTTNTSFFDLSFTSPAPSLLKDYTSVPWFHYSSTVAGQINRNEWEVAYRRNVLPSSSFGLGLKLYKILYNGNVLAENTSPDFVEDDDDIDNEVNPFTVNVANFPLPAPPTGEFELTAINTYSGVPIGQNDSLISTQRFSNYYAYDDGSAERIYRVTDNQNGCVIYKYDLRAADTLKGLYIYFLPGLENTPNNTFSIVIFENDQGTPGNLIYESDTLFTPQYSYTNQFLAYALPQDTIGVLLEGKPYFIGIRQTNNTAITFGFDVNSDTRANENLWYGPTNDLFPSFSEGAIMMRPFFRYVPDDIGLIEQPTIRLNFQAYPNPVYEDRLYVEVPHENSQETFHYRLFSLSGQLIREGALDREAIDVANLKSGVYLLQLSSSDSRKDPAFQKVVISH